ncbi:MAG: T9SS type A sorting domain-containing protein [Elusimicrobia bacterium]|nr:T9SS type A sorting domain-containing protein [Elusimicrobiota bacterium]
MRILLSSLLLAAAGVTPAFAAMTGGVFSVPLVAPLSGGGPASGGAYSVSSSVGAPAYSAASPSGGAFSLYSGGGSALLVIAVTARGDLGAAHCYPVPFKSALGHTKITFTGLTRSAVVRIYTVSGELVSTLEKNDIGETLDWDLRNSRGQQVASGVYVYVVKSGSQKNSGKLMVIW